MLVYVLLVVFGWMVDVEFGCFKLICWGVVVFGVVYVFMVVVGSKDLLLVGIFKVFYFLFVYIFVVGVGELLWDGFCWVIC